MRHFVCLLRPSGAPITGALREHVLRAGDSNVAQRRWLSNGCFGAVVELSGTGFGPTIVRRGSHVAVGDVRLDNREEVARWVCAPSSNCSDLELVLAAMIDRGARCIPDILGDFAFVIWNASSRDIIAARDAFGIGALYYAEAGDLIAFSSRASLLSRGDEYNLAFIADYLVAGNDPSEPSPYAGVTTLPSGSMLTCHDGSITVSEYWTPKRFEIDPTLEGREQAETFCDLFARAVALRLGSGSETWAQLSGGLDSSSVVCMAQSLARDGVVPSGIAGTITMVDSMGEGDEREFSNTVANAYQVRNEQVVDYWLWQDDGMPPPLTEAPTLNYPFWARDRRCCEVVRSAGGRILLTGQGSDQYLYGMPYFFADWIAQGRWRDAWRGMIEWTLLTRGSFWRFAHQNALTPLLPGWMRRRAVPQHQRMPPWITARFAKSFQIEQRHACYRVHAAPAGLKYAGAIAYETSHFGRYSNRTLFSEVFDARHPFLYRPLVELSLRLPSELRTQPLGHKWILREAMRGLLPELVRTRSGKGGIDARVAWSLARERGRLDEMIRDPVLANLGCVDPTGLRSALEEVRGGRTRHVAFLMITLSMETWLRARSGWWTVRESAPARALQLA